ncbi:MAG: ABC transporter ATP-binding protein, partial [Clostridia bacterium]|nr:ABC transporter ATP-binding protein [Clostridia bacterium]
MSETVIKIENVKKQYRLGAIGGGTLQADLQSWWARVRGKEDPNSVIGSKTYAKNARFYALDGINLEIKKGERLGIIGHNGAGK